MNNLGWYYYKKYYHRTTQTGTGDFESQSNTLTETRLPVIDKGEMENIPGFVQFDLSTTYPGLLIGSGYQHESGGTNEFKIGFFFDYVSGLPRIPGSSVKGMLRSCFPDRGKKELQAEKLLFIQEIMEPVSNKKLTNKQVFDLAEEVFEGSVNSNEKQEKITIYSRDRFLDGVISPVNHTSRKFMGSDFITPHNKNPLQDPLPIMFLKVLPEIIFRFQFMLHDSVAVEGVTAKHKEALFKSLLLQFGIGAKTNVGYGQFTKFSEDVPLQQKSVSKLPDNELPTWVIEELKTKKEFDVEIGEICDDYFEVLLKKNTEKEEGKFYKNKYKVKKDVFHDFKEKFSKKTKLILRVNQPYSNIETFNFTILLKQ